MALRLRVCKASEIAEGEVRGFAVEGVAEPILVTRAGGRLHATASMCPHGDVSLLDGEQRAGQLICPGHGYAFDLVSGRCTHDARMRLPLFQVDVIGDEVFVELVRPRR